MTEDSRSRAARISSRDPSVRFFPAPIPPPPASLLRINLNAVGTNPLSLTQPRVHVPAESAARASIPTAATRTTTTLTFMSRRA